MCIADRTTKTHQFRRERRSAFPTQIDVYQSQRTTSNLGYPSWRYHLLSVESVESVYIRNSDNYIRELNDPNAEVKEWNFYIKDGTLW